MTSTMMLGCSYIIAVVFSAIFLRRVKRKLILNVIFCGIIVIQLLIVGSEAYAIACEEAGVMWGGFGAFYGIILSLPLMGLSIVYIVKLILERLPLQAICLLITTLLIAPFDPFIRVGSFLSPCMVPFVARELDKERKQEQHDYETIKRRDYEFFIKIFSTPQKVAKMKGDLLLLENGRILKVCQYDRYYKTPKELEAYLSDKILGKQIMVDLGSFKYFDECYIPGGMSSGALELSGINVNEKDLFRNELLREIPVLDISIEGKSLLKNKAGEQSGGPQ